MGWMLTDLCECDFAFLCRCLHVADGMTGSGLAVILVLVLLAFAALLSATFYVLHRFVVPTRMRTVDRTSYRCTVD